jgi:hypothetical protein
MKCRKCGRDPGSEPGWTVIMDETGRFVAIECPRCVVKS